MDPLPTALFVLVGIALFLVAALPKNPYGWACATVGLACVFFPQLWNAFERI